MQSNNLPTSSQPKRILYKSRKVLPSVERDSWFRNVIQDTMSLLLGKIFLVVTHHRENLRVSALYRTRKPFPTGEKGDTQGEPPVQLFGDFLSGQKVTRRRQAEPAPSFVTILVSIRYTTGYRSVTVLR